jgi:hypothetical protein
LRRDFAAVMIAVESFAGHGFPPGLIVSSIDRIVSTVSQYCIRMLSSSLSLLQLM